MKIGTLLTTVIVSLSTVAGGLAVYVAATKHGTMDRVSDAQQRLEIIRAVGDMPRYLAWLVGRVAALGGTIEQRVLRSLTEADPAARLGERATCGTDRLGR